MVTHNLRFASSFGDRLLLMHRGGIVLDVSDGDKEKLKISDLTERFHEISIEDGNSL